MGEGGCEGNFEQVIWDGNRTNIRGFGQNMFAAPFFIVEDMLMWSGYLILGVIELTLLDERTHCFTAIRGECSI
jgi:hypothetical protein